MKAYRQIACTNCGRDDGTVSRRLKRQQQLAIAMRNLQLAKGSKRPDCLYAAQGVFAVKFPKFQYIRSPELLKACRQIPCQHCGKSDGTVVAAHSNLAKHGKGRSIKASDVFCASLCFTCHSALDQGSKMNKADRERMWDACHLQTVKELVRGGLWPLSVPVPIYTYAAKVRAIEKEQA